MMHAFVTDADGIDRCSRCARSRVAVENWGIFECEGPKPVSEAMVNGIIKAERYYTPAIPGDRPNPMLRVTAGNPETRDIIAEARSRVAVQCECPECVVRREKAMGLSAIWGIISTDGPPDPEPIAPPPTRWLTNLKPDTDTVEQRAAFLKKSGLACPTEITPDDIEAIGRIR